MWIGRIAVMEGFVRFIVQLAMMAGVLVGPTTIIGLTVWLVISVLD